MRKLYLRLCLVVGLCLIFGVQVGTGDCWAESVYSHVNVDYHTDYVEGPESVKGVKEEESTAANAMVQVQNGGELSEGSYDNEAMVITNFGIHMASTKVNIINANKEHVGAYAYSHWEDDWVVRAPPGVTEGELNFGITLHGNYAGKGNGLSYNIRCDGCDYFEIVEGRFPSVEDLDGSHRVKVTIGYSVDSFFTIESDLHIDTIIGNYEEGVTAESHVDAGNTVVLDSLNLPDGHTLETASGTTYPLDYTPPGTNTDTTTSGGGSGGGGCFISNLNK